MPSAAEILTAHETTTRIDREPNARPREVWVCGCGSEFTERPVVVRDRAYLLHLIGVAQEAVLSRDALMASILAARWPGLVGSLALIEGISTATAGLIADQILTDAGVTE
jgi:hypothetical protein